MDAPACVHCLDAMEQALDRALSGLQMEEGAYAAVIKGDVGRRHGGLMPGGGEGGGAFLAELAAGRAAQEEALQALEEQLEVGKKARVVWVEQESERVVWHVAVNPC